MKAASSQLSVSEELSSVETWKWYGEEWYN